VEEVFNVSIGVDDTDTHRDRGIMTPMTKPMRRRCPSVASSGSRVRISGCSGQLDFALGIEEGEARRDGRDREEKGRWRQPARLWQLLFGALLSFSISQSHGEVEGCSSRSSSRLLLWRAQCMS
jgi:hypothetical protein